ncbi:MAG TPA: hypothetical protein PKJ85_14205 [Nitrosomonas nitrosa]|uniref:hypothetical protein n=1 Tax=Nitrosomonas sp. TaxID=42353 RepID=UPI00207EC209|nr:hypothetical protein [Nitrosomonas sp.]GJL76777.1 MAG: hypothetical protein NMNS02_28830 [Nitrosomonas sp.]HNP52921.1 hypothetical protein [Nitrosomonas nitrosa]
MSIKMIKQFFVSMVVVSGIIFSGQVHAHGGLALADDLCILTVGPYTIHFTGYQPMSQEEEFCEDIPEIGKTVVALDYINDELRPFETEVRIVRSAPSLKITTNTTSQDLEKVSDEDLENMTIYHLPPKVYPNASILIDHTFPEKGKFAGVVTVTGNDQEWVSVFPFSVGEGLPINWFTDVLPYVALVAFAAFFFFRSRKKPEQEGSAA